MARQLLFHQDARDALLRGMETVATAVGATLGPRGQTVILGRPAGTMQQIPPQVTKDGVTVARAIALPDPWENEGAKLIQEVASRTNTEAGDGTTAATILTWAIFREGIEQVEHGADPQSLERGIHKAVSVVLEQLKSLTIPISDKDIDALRAVALIAANGDDEIGTVIAQAIYRAGREGNFSFDTSPTPQTTLQLAEGLEFKRGWMHPIFITNPNRGEVVFNGANILVTDRRLIDINQSATFLRMYHQHAKSVPLLIICEDCEGGALQLFATNHANGELKLCPVRTPAGGQGALKKEEVTDIAIAVGAKFFSKDVGDKIESATLEDLGSADRVVVTSQKTTIVGGHGSQPHIEARKEELRDRIADPETPDFERAMLERRLASLSAAVAVIRLGSSVQSKLLEKRDRAEDSLNATRAAVEEGIVPGGGTALLRCRPVLQRYLSTLDGDERLGAQIVFRALTAPITQLCVNCGVEALSEALHSAGALTLSRRVRMQWEQFRLQVLRRRTKSALAWRIAAVINEVQRATEVSRLQKAWGEHKFESEEEEAIWWDKHQHLLAEEFTARRPKGQPEHYGFNAALSRFENLVHNSIVDPAKVVRLALQNSAELSGLLLTSAALVVDKPFENPQPAQRPVPNLRA